MVAAVVGGLLIGAICWAYLHYIAAGFGLIFGSFIGLGISIGVVLHHMISFIGEVPETIMVTCLVAGFAIEITSFTLLGEMLWVYLT